MKVPTTEEQACDVPNRHFFLARGSHAEMLIRLSSQVILSGCNMAIKIMLIISVFPTTTKDLIKRIHTTYRQCCQTGAASFPSLIFDIYERLRCTKSYLALFVSLSCSVPLSPPPSHSRMHHTPSTTHSTLHFTSSPNLPNNLHQQDRAEITNL